MTADSGSYSHAPVVMTIARGRPAGPAVKLAVGNSDAPACNSNGQFRPGIGYYYYLLES